MLNKVAAPALSGLATVGDARQAKHKAAVGNDAKEDDDDDDELTKLKREEEAAAITAAQALKPEFGTEKTAFGGRTAAGAAVVEQQQADKKKPLLLGSAAAVYKVGNMTGHAATGKAVEKPWLDPKKGGLQTAPKRKIGMSMGPLAMGPNGGAMQNSRYAAVEEKVFVPPSATSQAKADDLKKKLGY